MLWLYANESRICVNNSSTMKQKSIAKWPCLYEVPYFWPSRFVHVFPKHVKSRDLRLIFSVEGRLQSMQFNINHLIWIYSTTKCRELYIQRSDKPSQLGHYIISQSGLVGLSTKCNCLHSSTTCRSKPFLGFCNHSCTQIPWRMS